MNGHCSCRKWHARIHENPLCDKVSCLCLQRTHVTDHSMIDRSCHDPYRTHRTLLAIRNVQKRARKTLTGTNATQSKLDDRNAPAFRERTHQTLLSSSNSDKSVYGKRKTAGFAEQKRWRKTTNNCYEKDIDHSTGNSDD